MVMLTPTCCYGVKDLAYGFLVLGSYRGLESARLILDHIHMENVFNAWNCPSTGHVTALSLRKVMDMHTAFALSIIIATVTY